MRCTWPQHCCARRVLKLSLLLSGLCWFVPFDGFFSSFPIICLYRCSGVSLPLLELCVLCRAGRVWLRKRGWGCVFTRAVCQARAVLAVAERSSITFSVACSCMFLWCGDAVKNGEKNTLSNLWQQFMLRSGESPVKSQPTRPCDCLYKSFLELNT